MLHFTDQSASGRVNSGAIVLLQEHDFSEHVSVMRFHLTYDGPLKCNGSPNHKHEIRQVFHPQLRCLWSTYSHLTDMPILGVTKEQYDYDYKKKRSDQYARNGYKWLPLVDTRDSARVGVDILMLRQGPAGGLVSRNGDIDNRLKTLFDALQMPEHAEQLGKYLSPREGEDPFYCLLQDDKLIGKVSVEGDALLEPLKGKDVIDPNDVRLFITVEIKAIRGYNYRFA